MSCLLKQSIRIIGGRFRGKKIAFPDENDLRPTPNRVRETLFNWLMHHIHNASCLDAFAGSGALGLEAFSRGAKDVTFIEQSNKACSQLRKTCQAFDATALRVVQDDCCRYMAKRSSDQTTAFDIIFADPPFSKPDLLQKFISQLENTCLLKQHGLLYLETPEAQLLNPATWKCLKSQNTGQLTYALYQKTNQLS